MPCEARRGEPQFAPGDWIINQPNRRPYRVVTLACGGKLVVEDVRSQRHILTRLEEFRLSRKSR
jgi:hypothetical protein